MPTVRCRLRRQGVVIELDDETIASLSSDRRELLIEEMRERRPDLAGGQIKILPYRRGSAFVGPKDQARR